MRRQIFLLAMAASCAPAAPGPLRLRTERTSVGTRITLLVEPGFKVNARLKPALELHDGRVVRFDSSHLTPDSAYFTEPPFAEMAGGRGPLHGKLRASVCDAGETVCRSVEAEI